MIQALNNRNNTQFGTGLPIYKKIDHQTRYNTTRPYYQGLLVAPPFQVPTFQVKVPENIDKVNLYDGDGNLVDNMTVGGDDTFEVIVRPMSDGEYLVIVDANNKATSAVGIHHARLGLIADGAGVYRYWSEEFRNVAAPCTLNNPIIP